MGAITGPGDVLFATSYASDGGGLVVLTQTSSYTGQTFVAQGSTRAASPTASVPMVRLGVNNALPTTTNLIFGAPDVYSTAYNSGALDLNGKYQEVASITTAPQTPAATGAYFGGLNNYAAGTGTLAICNNALATSTSANETIEAQFRAVIGTQILDATSGRPTSGTASNNNICLQLLPNNNGTLTLGLGHYSPYGTTAGVNFSQANTYNGGTTISGGALFAANGSTYWDGARHREQRPRAPYGTALVGPGSGASVPNSATGTGPVVVNVGGTFGGSLLGGAVGMPDSVAYASGAVGPTGGSLNAGAVIVNSGGYLLPGGGYYVDATGNGGPNWAPNGSAGTQAVGADTNFHPTVGGTAFRVLGNLILNGGANVNFNVNPTSFDAINVGGALSLAPTGGNVTVNLNSISSGALINGMPLFSGFSSFTVNGSGLSNLNLVPNVILAGSGGLSVGSDSLKLVNNQIDLLVPGATFKLLRLERQHRQ